MPTTRRFERILLEAVERTRTRLLAYCLMRNHWHLVVWPKQDGELSQFVGGLTLTHTQRWHAFRASRSGLARSREFATDRGRTGGVATVRRSRQPVRQRRMDRADHPQAGPGIDDPPPRPAQNVAQRFLTPFTCSLMCSFYVFQPERAAPGRHARGADDIVVFRSAKEAPFRGAKATFGAAGRRLEVNIFT